MANAFNLTAQLNLQGPANITSVVNNIRRQLGNINANVNVVINPNTNRNITALNSSFQTFNRTLRDTRTVTRDAASAITALGRAINQAANPLNNLNVNLRNNINATAQLAQNLQNTNRACNQAGGAFEAFGRQAGNAIRRAAAFSTVAGLVYKLGNSFNAASKEFIEFNKELVRVAQVTDTNLNNLGSLVKQITDLSTSLGVSSSELIKVSSTLAQAGLSAKDTEKALKAVARSALAPSFDSMNDTVEGSIALMRQFGIEAGQLENALGSINAVSAKFAVEASDLITAIQRTGGVFASASKGVSSGTDALNEFLAVFTSIRATTRESAETIATGLRTIFARIQRSETIENLQRFGVLLTDLEGKFVGPYEAVRRLSEGLSRLDPRDLRFAEIVEELGGFRQIGKVIPLIQQFAVSQQALKVAQSGQASLSKDIAVAQESVANKITKVREEFIALIRSIGESQNFQTFVKLSLDLASALIKLADAAKNVLPAIAAVTAIRSIGPAVQYGRGFIGGLTGRARRNNGGPIGFASGGFVPGQGNSDTVPAMLTPGEFVIRKKAVQALGVENLHRVNKYSGGGRVKRNIGYIDSDVMADPANASIVRAEMERLGISDVHKYKLHISTLAANKRKSGDIKKLTTVYGAAGSGKSTLSQGGSRGSQSDNATLRQTIRYPILTEADILKSDQIIDLTSVAGPNQKVFLSASDRIISLSSRTKESQEILKQNRMSRDRTGVGLFGRKIGATKSAPLDSGMGEAYIAAKDVSGVDPKKVITYKIGSNFSRSRTNQPNVRSPEKIGLFYGNFGPTTAGHLSVVEEAKKLGIKPSDFIALIGGDTPIDFSNKDEHSRRTAIMPQMSRVGPSRLGMAKATFGAMGADVSPMPKGSSPGSIPSAFKVGDDSYIVPKGINDIAFVGDEKEEKSLEKYSKLGYSVKSLPRISNISGTAAREAIMNNDIAAMKKLLSPEGFKYIQDNLAIIQQRPILLDSILEHFQKNSQQGRGLSGRLGSIKDELSNLPGRITKTRPPS